MRKPSLSVDTFVAALSVLGALGATATATGCSKADHASVAPEPASAAATAAPKTEGAPAAPAEQPVPAAVPAAAPGADPAAAGQAADEKKPAAPPASPQKAAVAAPVGATALDGGVKRAADSDDKKKAGMSCGAGMCSADMKKGSGN
ncbi:MAG: hypothetical protein QOI41_3077 [Myxococcales bacterium]|nr:hypothetical protein [Myxococcales bacterium]